MNRVILLLAGSNLSEKDMARSLREICRISERELFNLIHDLRSRKHFLSGELGLSSYEDSETSHQTRNDFVIVEQISKMLREDSGLTVAEASELLTKSLRKHLSEKDRARIPTLNKESFSAWLLKILGLFPPSLVLHESAKIRNRAAHQSRSDWPLGERE